jgi:hypothetical protein
VDCGDEVVRGEASVGSAMVKRMVSRLAIRSDFKDYFLVIMCVCVVCFVSVRSETDGTWNSAARD